MRGKKKPPLDLTPVADDTPLTFDTMAKAYLEDYMVQRYRTMNTAQSRVEHLREFLGGWPVETITVDAVWRYQLHRRKQGAEAATINRETSALSRMFQLAIRRRLLERMPLFSKRLEENPPAPNGSETALPLYTLDVTQWRSGPPDMTRHRARLSSRCAHLLHPSSSTHPARRARSGHDEHNLFRIKVLPTIVNLTLT